MDLKNIYFKIIHKVPSYSYAEGNTSKRKIKEFMLKCGHDEKYIEGISDDFCQGFGVAKAMILELIGEEINHIKE